MADRPEGKAGDPEPKAKPDRAGEGAVDDRKAARRAAEQDRLGERAVDRREETRNVGLLCHQTSAPPPKEKKERKKLDAAKAIDRPETKWTRRGNRPGESRKGRVTTVT